MYLIGSGQNFHILLQTNPAQPLDESCSELCELNNWWCREGRLLQCSRNYGVLQLDTSSDLTEEHLMPIDVFVIFTSLYIGRPLFSESLWEKFLKFFFHFQGLWKFLKTKWCSYWRTISSVVKIGINCWLDAVTAASHAENCGGIGLEKGYEGAWKSLKSPWFYFPKTVATDSEVYPSCKVSHSNNFERFLSGNQTTWNNSRTRNVLDCDQV